jgi:hypothetical protein
LVEFRWLVYSINFIQQNYSCEFCVHDDHKLTQYTLHVQVATLEHMLHAFTELYTNYTKCVECKILL